ncbi:AP-1 complex-associated regulatory protein-like [Watersipora subatra]|uniref:AP-1 complex-associated regulatory protein-like n=1 Tax=Watersipora subatra TaxID=2589382 RepID=UPI00355C5DB0
MGNCWCVKAFYKRRVLRQYTSLDSGAGPVHEAEDLFDDDDGDGLMSSTASPSAAAITENEKLLLRSKNYAAIISSQKTFDEQIDKQLAEQEEKLKREEEELLKLRRSQQSRVGTGASSKSSNPDSDVPWSADDGNSEWNVAGGENDFDMFLDAISTREQPSNSGACDDEIDEADFVSGITSS